MKKIIIIAIQDCIACEIAYKMLKSIINNKDIKLEFITCNRDIASEKYHAVVFPTVIFKEDMREIARVFGTMPKDFYEIVIDKFEKL